MKPVRWMIGASVGSWLAAAALLGGRTGLEVFLGMIGPLVAASTTWIITERTLRQHPERVMSLMVKAFAAKVVFFVVYVALLLRLLLLRPVPFVVSFMSYFIALHLFEAMCLQRLFAGRTGAT